MHPGQSIRSERARGAACGIALLAVACASSTGPGRFDPPDAASGLDDGGVATDGSDGARWVPTSVDVGMEDANDARVVDAGVPDTQPDAEPDAQRVEPSDCRTTIEEPNEHPAEAFRLEGPAELDGRLCRADADWFVVALSAGETLTLALTFEHEVGDLELRLERADTGELLGRSETAADEERLQAGPFEVATEVQAEVYGYRGATGPYMLRSTILAAPERFAPVHGSVRYDDQIYDETGFTGEVVLRPARDVVVEIVHVDDGAVVATGQTDEQGQFTIDVGLHEGHRYQVRALAVVQVGANRVRVRDRSRSRALYAVVSDPLDAEALPAHPIALVAARETSAGGAMNIADVSGTALRFVAAYTDQAAPTLTYDWQAGQPFPCGSCYGGNRISLGGQLEDPDEYDDDIILHELGHYFVEHFSADSSPGGTHRDRQVDPRLAYGEGLAYFFSSLVQLDPVIVDNFLDSQRVIDIEAVTHNMEDRPDLRGTTNGSSDGNLREEIVAAVLWDALDPFDEAEPFDEVEIGPDGHMHILLDYFGGGLDGMPFDVNVPGIDLVDWLNAASCYFPDILFPLIPIVEDREFPWMRKVHVRCGIARQKARRATLFALSRREGHLWLVPTHDANAPGWVRVREGTPWPGQAERRRCDHLPCRVTRGVGEHHAVVVTGRYRGESFGASWLGKAAADRMRGGAARAALSTLGPARAYRSGKTPQAR